MRSPDAFVKEIRRLYVPYPLKGAMVNERAPWIISIISYGCFAIIVSVFIVIILCLVLFFETAWHIVILHWITEVAVFFPA